MQYIEFSDNDEMGKSSPLFSLIIILFCIFAICYFSYKKSYFDYTVLKNVDMEPFSQPIQESIDKNTPKNFFIEANGSKAYLTPLATYKLYGRVYTKHYVPVKMSFGTVIPYDMAIGWGKMAERDNFNKMKMKYALFDRVVYWQYKNINMTQEEINDSFSNNHLIPANKRIKQGLDRLGVKDVVYLEGYLVEVHNHKRDGTKEEMKSSLWREDEGLGACEVIYITRLVSKHGEYK